MIGSGGQGNGADRISRSHGGKEEMKEFQAEGSIRVCKGPEILEGDATCDVYDPKSKNPLGVCLTLENIRIFTPQEHFRCSLLET